MNSWFAENVVMTENHVGRQPMALTIEPAAVDGPEARYALQQYVAELERRFPSGFDTSRAAPPQPGAFTPPAGVFLLVRADGQVRGCGALRFEDTEVAEIRRMWIDPEVRGRGIGRSLLESLESCARAQGCVRVVLDTAGELTEAKSLYASAGYVEVPAYNDNAYAEHWFEKVLG